MVSVCLIFLEEQTASVPIGSKGVIYHPYLNTSGVVAPFFNPNARAQFFGLSIQNTKKKTCLGLSMRVVLFRCLIVMKKY